METFDSSAAIFDITSTSASLWNPNSFLGSTTIPLLLVNQGEIIAAMNNVVNSNAKNAGFLEFNLNTNTWQRYRVHRQGIEPRTR